MTTISLSELMSNKDTYLNQEVIVEGYLLILRGGLIFLTGDAPTLFVDFWEDVLSVGLFAFYANGRKYEIYPKYPMYSVKGSVNGTFLAVETVKRDNFLQLSKIKQITLQHQHPDIYKEAFASDTFSYQGVFEPLPKAETDEVPQRWSITSRILIPVQPYNETDLISTQMIDDSHAGKLVKLSGELHCRFGERRHDDYMGTASATEYFSVIDDANNRIALLSGMYEYRVREIWARFEPIGGKVPETLGFRLQVIGRIYQLPPDHAYYRQDVPDPQWAFDDVRHIILERTEEYTERHNMPD